MDYDGQDENEFFEYNAGEGVFAFVMNVAACIAGGLLLGVALVAGVA